VFSANPDGSDLKVIVSEGRRLPDGIRCGHRSRSNLLDQHGQPQRNDGSIERANLDGSNITHIVRPGTLSLPSNCNSMRRTGSSTGAIAKGCGSCAPTWMVPTSKSLVERAKATASGASRSSHRVAVAWSEKCRPDETMWVMLLPSRFARSMEPSLALGLPMLVQ